MCCHNIYNMKFSVIIRNAQLSNKYARLKKCYQRRLLNLKIKDIHGQINYLTIKIEKIEEILRSKLPVDLLKNFFESNGNKINKYDNEMKMKLENKFNKIKILQNNRFNNFFNIDKSKWIVNNTNKVIPEYVMNVLSLGGKFGLPVKLDDEKDRRDTALNVIKNFEASSYKFHEKSLDSLRTIMVNSLNKHLYDSKHISYIDAHILKEFNKCKRFLKYNEDVFLLQQLTKDRLR